MLSPFAAKVFIEINRLNEAEVRLAASDLSPAEKRRRAGHLARRRRRLRVPSPFRPVARSTR
jgi:hypothetical protein